MKNIIKKYSSFVSHHPFIILALVAVVSVAAFMFASNVGTKSMDNSDMLPEDYEVITAFEILGDNFGGDASAMIVIEIDPKYPASGEPRDVRTRDIIEYMNIIGKMADTVESITAVNSPATLLKSQNNGFLPKSRREIIEMTSNPSYNSYISSDYEIALIRLSLSDDYSGAELVDELEAIINQVEKPAGTIVNLAGETVADPIIEEQIGPDMGRTSQISLLGIIIVLVLLFRSIKYSLTPLSVIAIGVLWAFGYLGLRGLSLSSATSGVISMIMGIGIDFGIQTITRFRHELKDKNPEKAMETTMNGVFMPMATTTLSALIGFRAMSMGELSMMGEFGDIMSYGITACFFAAITVVPALMVVAERYFPARKKKKRFKNPKKIFKKLINETNLMINKRRN